MSPPKSTTSQLPPHGTSARHAHSIGLQVSGSGLHANVSGKPTTSDSCRSQYVVCRSQNIDPHGK